MQFSRRSFSPLVIRVISLVICYSLLIAVPLSVKSSANGADAKRSETVLNNKPSEPANEANKVASPSGKDSSGEVVDEGAALQKTRGNPNPSNSGDKASGASDDTAKEFDGQRYVPAALRPENASRKNRHDGLMEQPLDSVLGAPAPNLPNLEELRTAQPAETGARHTSQFIQPSFPCADCDPQGGGGGGQYYPAGDPNFSAARLQPQNEVGQAGVDLGSRNFSWSQSLLSLPGRAGLGLNLSLAYNSLVWTKDGDFIKYNADLGNPAPGFRLGLPILQQRFANPGADTVGYIMVLPSGARVEMRAAGVGVYESADSTYTQLKENGTIYGIVARHTGMSAAVADASMANGAQVVQWPDPGSNTNFQWELIPTDSGYYKLVNQNSLKVATVTGASQANGANVVQSDWTGGTNQQWQIVSLSNGYYKLVARHSGKVLQVASGSTTQGANLQQGPDNGTTHQQWLFAPLATTPLTVRTADGTEYTFNRVAVNNEYRCTQIKDRNGNYISAAYDYATGHVQTITDTLQRVITFDYADNNLQAIRQTWAGGTHYWAQFTYDQVLVNPQFTAGVLVNGPNNNLVTVLTRVDLADGSSYRFDYNTAFGQVKQINRWSADNNLLSYVKYNLDSSTGQADCPRFTEQRDWAKYWNGDSEGTPATGEESVTGYAVATDNSWSKITFPDQTIYKEFFATTGWQKGLTTSAKNFINAADEAANTPQKWTTTEWTQDDENLSFSRNPRVEEANVYDAAGNQRRSRIDYATFSLPSGVSCSLPTDLYEYASDHTTVYRKVHTDYNIDASYLALRIIGLVSGTTVLDGAGNVLNKLTYCYDCDQAQISNTPAAAVQHDTSYNTTDLNKKRGNRMVEGRWDASDPQNANKQLYRRWSYDTAGNVIATTDPLSHSETASYADSFSDGVDNRNTFAYPTTTADADGYQTLTKYNFDFGAITWTQTPAPNAGTPPTTSFTYDSVGRIQRVTNDLNTAFTEWVYPTSTLAVNRFTTIDPGSISNSTLRAFSSTLLDGAGRARATVSDHPGSTGLYRGQYVIYNNMGRVAQQSNPTEMTIAWAPAGDDQTSGWISSQQAYDWKGRPTVTTNPDGTTRVTTYGGCGCAGGEVVTVQDETGRQRRMTKDSFGRLWKVEELSWPNPVTFARTTYATTTYTYNRRDQLTQSNQEQQLRDFAYDGYGRLQTRTTPEQGATNYAYKADGTTDFITDARGAKATFGYNARRLLTSVSYDLSNLVPGQSVAATPSVSFTYDPAGNRRTMTDGLGSVAYDFDNLSQLSSETRTFSQLSPLTYATSYTYNLVGQLATITNPFGTVVNYGYDKVGRLTGATGAAGASPSVYASSMTYRAFGALKGMSYGDGKNLSTSYDNRLRTTKWDVTNVLGYNYEYDTTFIHELSGRVTYAESLNDPTLDRSYQYDQVGRLVVAHSGAEARAHVETGNWGTMDGPYSQGYEYDPWGNMTHRYGWGGDVQGGTAGQSTDIYNTYTGNRRDGFSYDLAGNLTNDLGQVFTYDATGQQATASFGGYSLQQSYDGNGLRVKKNDNGTVTYYVRSTVLGGQVVAEADATGAIKRTYTYLGGQLVSLRNPAERGGGNYWIHEDPVAKSKRVTTSTGTVTSAVELDPWGADTNRSSSVAFQPRTFTTYDRDGNKSDEAMFRRYNRYHSRFDQPDPYGGSYSFTDPQSFNRYSYVNNDPVNTVDPSGLVPCTFDEEGGWCIGDGGSPVDPGNPWDRYLDPGDRPSPFSGPDIGGRGPGGGIHEAGHLAGPSPEQRASDKAAELLQKTNCANFIFELIAIAASVAVQRGAQLTPSFSPLRDYNGNSTPSYGANYALRAYNSALTGGRVTASGVSGRIGDSVTYGETTGNYTISWNTEFYGLSLNDQALQTLHESLHLIPNFSDFAVAGAAHIMATRGRNSPGNPGSFKDRAAASRYINEQIRAHCSP